MALHLARLDLEVADRALELRIPIDQALVAIGEATLVELDERVGDGAAEALVHGEALVGPVARPAEPPQLAGDRAARLLLPLPDMLEERLAADLRALDALAGEVALDDHLGGDPGMVHSDHPARVLAVHPSVADENVLQCIVEGVADV